VHELSHLLHPLIEGDSRWLYEGLASYYQNVLRARQGLIPAATAWEKLHAGFRRGRKGTRPSQTLARASEAMLRERAFMRVYWSGAAIALLSDLELRRVSGGRQSLDSVLSDLQRCCLPSDRLWGEREVIDKLDALSGTRIFSRLYDRYIDNDDFPDLRAAYSFLGLQPEDDETLHLVGGRAATDLRKGIMGGE
jgi:predicted metalloprotease with PDZ domain